MTDPIRSRDRDATEAAILQAALTLLAEQGFAALGVNAIARAAGCDKQLVYRYFGGREGLVDAMGAALARRMTERLARVPLPAAVGYGERVRHLLCGWVEVLRDDPLLRSLLVWEISDPAPEVRRLSEARGRAMGLWVMQALAGTRAPEGVDAPVVNALLIGAVQQMVLAAATAGRFSGVELQADADWERVKRGLMEVTTALYG
ncbi:TetR/AcrR family transcriptional regulator [Fuscibacter oryzae]|uniref:TetR/AcrR family transcriptional regulator n=1 Tax=Fuscibacter oryzae TaxID=2803939 RepID=A0A8J7MRQ0_9RHOB|nr:TetR/AcrR family transcriptional regulator [Fuscibacter oryzae]MBL4928738.1 TetR/AcrR family transcriptional regulator [Fuscibacter oryzae]